MTIEGPIPPNTLAPDFIQKNMPHLPHLAAAHLASRLAAAAPTSPPASTGDSTMTDAQKNTFWFLRMYSDCLMIALNSWKGQDTTAFINDLKYILNQLTNSPTSNPPFDPQLIADLQNDISNPAQYLNAGAMPALMNTYNQIISGNPTPPYQNCYDFSHLNQDDTFQFYMIQIAGSIIINSDNNFWGQNGQISDFGANFQQFICSYLWQRQDLKNDTPLCKEALDSLYQMSMGAFNCPCLKQALGGIDDKLAQLQNGQWPFSSPPPQGDDHTPGPWWNQPQTPSWNYYAYDPYQDMINDWLRTYIKQNP